jgi:predicted enzyme related to lactoylglutathione lyase
VYEVKDLEAAATALAKRGWKREGEPFEVPNGPCFLFHDPSGNPIAFLEDQRPGTMES